MEFKARFVFWLCFCNIGNKTDVNIFLNVEKNCKHILDSVFFYGIRNFIFYFDNIILEMLQKIINVLKIENCKNFHWIVYFWNGIRSFILYFDYAILEMLQKIKN